ncbi:hypothetical protein ACFUEN_23630 [Streptomyces griseorubiginosus]|uniref:hypothetical protein n=1 Tax=Streptomyces griseorubiginosus TaxID=67304 RepID=UPI003640FF6E
MGTGITHSTSVARYGDVPMIQGYDGDALLSQLEALTAPQRRAFSTACAEVLLLHFASVSTVGHSAGTEECERVVHFCWDAVERGALESGPSETVDLLRAGLEEILSQDEEGELEAMEHVIAGAYYALASSRAGDAGRAELVAKNLYEAADYTILADPATDLVDPNARREILASDVVQWALSAIVRIHDLVATRTFQGDVCAVEISQVREFVSRGTGNEVSSGAAAWWARWSRPCS